MNHPVGPPYIRMWSCRNCGEEGFVAAPPECPNCGADDEDWYEEFDNTNR